MDFAYAALFCAFRLDCAGVKSSLSTLSDLRSSRPRSVASPSSSMPIIPSPSMEERLCTVSEGVELELLCLIPVLLLLLVWEARWYSNTAGMKLLRFVSKFGSSSMLCKFPVLVIFDPPKGLPNLLTWMAALFSLLAPWLLGPLFSLPKPK